MIPLKFFPGPVLMHQAYPMPNAVDVACLAHRYLFDVVEIDPAVTLSDVFGLLRASPLLVEIYAPHWASDLLAEADKGAMEPDVPDDPCEVLELIELQSHWYLDTSDRSFSPVQRLHLHALGPVLQEDKPEYAKVVGERVEFGVSLSNIRTLLKLPIRLNPKITVVENDIDAFAYGKTLDEVTLEGVTLGQVIHGLLWELAFHGGPQETAEVETELQVRLEEVHEAERNPDKPSPFISGDDFFDEFHRDGCSTLFDSVGQHRPSEVHRALREIADDGNVVDALRIVFGESVIVKAAYANLPGRPFRKAFRKADRSHLIERMKSRRADEASASGYSLANEAPDEGATDETPGS